MGTAGKSMRIQIDGTPQTSTLMFSYKDLLKRKQKAASMANLVGISSTSEQDKFLQGLLERVSKNDVQDDPQPSDDEDDGDVKKRGPDDYDYDDPFIDDSDMFLDDTHEYEAPQFDGFFTYKGPLDAGSSKRKAAGTATSKSKAKQANKKDSSSNGNNITSTTTTTNNNSGKSRKSTTTKTDTTDTTEKNDSTVDTNTKTTKSTKKNTSKDTLLKPPLKKQAASEGGDKKKISKSKKESVPTASTSSVSGGDKKTSASTDLHELDPLLEEKMNKLRKDALLESFENKAKFPPSLRPTVLEAGLTMFRLNNDKVDDNLIGHLMAVLPYNRFTLRKFLTTKSGSTRVEELQKEIDSLTVKLKDKIDEMMPEQRKQHNDRIASAQTQQQVKQQQQQQQSVGTEEKTGTSTAPSSLATPEEDPALVQKFKCNDSVRKILYDIMQKDGARIFLSNSIAELEKKTENVVAEGKARKQMYQKLLSCWPEGWMTTYEMSRQYSQYKLKIDKNKATTSQSTATGPSSLSKKAEKDDDDQKTKRKRPQPSLSQSEESARKKQSISLAETGHAKSPLSSQETDMENCPDASVQAANQNLTLLSPSRLGEQPPYYDISLQESPSSATDSQNMAWKRSPSMKIESLISGPPTEDVAKDVSKDE